MTFLLLNKQIRDNPYIVNDWPRTVKLQSWQKKNTKLCVTNRLTQSYYSLSPLLL